MVMASAAGGAQSRGLMQKVGCPNVTETSGGKSCLPNLHRMKLPFDVAAPKIEKPARLRKIRGKVELLPDEALQQVGVIGEMLDDLRRSQPILPEFGFGVGHMRSPRIRTRLP